MNRRWILTLVCLLTFLIELADPLTSFVRCPLQFSSQSSSAKVQSLVALRAPVMNSAVRQVREEALPTPLRIFEAARVEVADASFEYEKTRNPIPRLPRIPLKIPASEDASA